ncbi:MAG: histidinol-phosphate transaminase [Acidobacteria bacterium]|nr:histidinol-phosphate transaminase [Acidobacteriota bacterium]
MSFSDIVPKHIQNIQPYKPGKPVEEVERELGIKAVKLASNENPLGPAPKAVEAVRRYLENMERYPDDTTYYLRQRLAESFKVSMDEIILGSGSSDILAMAYHALMTPDAEVLTSEGSFIVYYLLAQTMGIRLVSAPMKDYGFNLSAMAELLSPRTRLILIANPNNPTGSIVRRKELEAFLGKVPDHALIILDEAYFEYVGDPDYPDSFEYLRSGKSILIIRTFSKAYGLAGLRIGYGVSHREVIETLHKVRMAFNTGSLAQVAALAAWDDRAHVEKSVASNRAELEFLYSELSRRGVKHVPSHANFIFMDLGKPSADVNTAMLKQGVIIRPMAGWGFPTMIRVSVGTHEQNVKFLAALDQLLV